MLDHHEVYPTMTPAGHTERDAVDEVFDVHIAKALIREAEANTSHHPSSSSVANVNIQPQWLAAVKASLHVLSERCLAVENGTKHWKHMALMQYAVDGEIAVNFINFEDAFCLPPGGLGGSRWMVRDGCVSRGVVSSLLPLLPPRARCTCGGRGLV